MSRLWDKGSPLSDQVLRYTAGEDHQLDARLVAYDVAGSKAHASMLAAQGLISDDDASAINNGLDQLARSHAGGEWSISLEDEDVHTALESRLTAMIGAAGGRLHLGRSRNDQVLTALRLYLKDACAELASEADGVVEALERMALRQGEVALPGYTHLQQAMPSSVALWAQGYAEEIRDDGVGINAAHRRLDRSPLGSAAGYGVPGLPLDRSHTQQSLKFAAVHEPVTAVQLSRGKAEAELVFQMLLLLNDLGRLASDLLLFYTREFSYVRLPESITTGSSIMPQKRNPDVLELIRSAGAVVQGALNEIIAITAKLNSGYHRDLQRIKAPLFRAIDLTLDSTAIMAQTLDDVEFIADNIVLDDGLYAAERANRLVVEQGIPFREAYQRVAAELKSERD
ncbi:MAG: argininosuccinate lyase [Gammaproteobacteria bacterium]